VSPTVFGLSVFTIFGLLVALVLLGTVIRYLRRNRPVTKYHLPAILLLLLGVAAAFGTVVGVEVMDRDLNGIEYTVRAEQPPAERSADTPSDTTAVITTDVPGTKMGGPYEFEELSPGAQDVFRSTVQRDGTYTTRTHPPEFQDDSPGDVGGPGYTFVRYDSTWYKLTSDAGGGPLAGIGYAVVLPLGILLATISLVVGWAALVVPSFKWATAVLVGLSTVVVSSLTAPGWTILPGLESPVFTVVLVTLVVWVLLRLLETQMTASFRERMTTTDGH
jgi:hypothetical protein